MNPYRPNALDYAANLHAIAAHNAGLIDLSPSALEAAHLIVESYRHGTYVSPTTIARARANLSIHVIDALDARALLAKLGEGS